MTSDDDRDPPPHGTFAKAPEHGVRFELVLEEQGEGRAVYQGFAFLPDRKVPLVVVAEIASATATIGGDDRPTNADALEKAAVALVRAATRQELSEGAAVPRKIVRWRAT